MPANKVQTQEEAEKEMVDIPNEGNPVDIDLSEDKKEKIVNPPEEQEVVVEETEVKETDDEEVENYSKKVQSRIDRLTKKAREAERREQAALEYAQGLQKERDNYAQRNQFLEPGYINEYTNRVEAQTAEAKKQLKEAMDLGDVDAQVEANQKIARLAIEADRAKKSQEQRERLKKEMESRGVDPNQPQMPAQNNQQRTNQPPPPPDPKAEAWAEKNTWFGSDEPMTLTSFSIHRKLIEEGFDASSDEYYNEVDKRMRDTFPHRFESGKVSTPSQIVASANRSTPVKRKSTVRLTPSQVAIAKKLGVPLKEYAKYVKE
tara:strand:- start:200 stop:1153 length:954 start_codon:yes stop_codon:yes gene_type:complete